MAQLSSATRIVAAENSGRGIAFLARMCASVESERPIFYPRTKIRKTSAQVILFGERIHSQNFGAHGPISYHPTTEQGMGDRFRRKSLRHHPSPCLSNEASSASANLLVPLEESFLQFGYLLIGILLSKALILFGGFSISCKGRRRSCWWKTKRPKPLTLLSGTRVPSTCF